MSPRSADMGNNTIPDDWSVVPLGQLLLGFPTYGINAAACSLDSRFPTYLRITDISDEGRFIHESRVSVHHPSAESYVMEAGDLVFARTGASVGKSYLYDPRDGTLVYAGFLIRVRPNPEKLVPGYLKYVTQTQDYWSWVSMNSTRTGQPGINGQQYARLPIPLPPTKAEQETIAEALSDADALIESLEQLIAKRRRINQGAMQGLLSGMRRLPGFVKKPGTRQTDIGIVPADWIVKRVDEMGSVLAGKALNAKGPGQRRPYLRTKNVFDGRIDLDDVLFMPFTTAEFERFRLRRDDVLLNEGQSLDLVGRCSIYRNEYPGPCGIQNQLIRFRAFPNVSAEFASFLFRNCQGNGTFAQIATQTTSVAHLGVSRFAGLFLAWPSEQEEQSAIAAVLSDMDAELSALEAKLAKARQIKRGMMHNLLTGRIRLV